MSLFIKNLHHLKKSQEMVAIGRRYVSDHTSFAQIRGFSDFLIQITEYDRIGRYAGISVFYQDDVSELFWETPECRFLQKNASLRTLFEIPELRLQSLSAAIEDLGKRFGTVLFWNDSEQTHVRGEVLDVDEEWVEIRQTDEESGKSFENLIRLGLVTRIQADAQEFREQSKSRPKILARI